MHTGKFEIFIEIYLIWKFNCKNVIPSLSSLTKDVIPSFILLAIQGSRVVTYVYELHGEQVDVSKSEFSKL